MSELAEGLADDLRRVLHHLQALDKAEVEAIVASELASLAEMTGSGRLRHAAAVLRGKIGGRPAFDAESAIAEAENLYREGRARTLNRAFLMVALTMQTAAKPKSVAEILRRKHRI